MKFYNAFGIKPTNTYTSAGTDYYIPNLDTQEKIEKAYRAFEKSYEKTQSEILKIDNALASIIKIKELNYLTNHVANLVHLYLAFYNSSLEAIKKDDFLLSIEYFIQEFVMYDEKNNKVGLKVSCNDTLFINSGIKVALDTVLSDQKGPNSEQFINMLRLIGIGIAGLYVNKSGNGNKGWDVRACLVDEDYAGFVHLSMSYTKETIEDKQNIIYCGDKLTQMMLIPVFHSEYIETDEDEYNKIMQNSQRGDNAFGSSDIKH